MLYEKPIMEILIFDVKDVVCTSGVTVNGTYDGEDGNGSSGSGAWYPPTE